MAYLPPNYNAVNVDLYKSGGIVIPNYNAVNVDLYISDEVIGPSLISILPYDDEYINNLVVVKTREIIQLSTIESEEVLDVVLINRPAVICDALDDESIGDLVVTLFIRDFSIPAVESSEVGSVVVTHYVRDFPLPAIESEGIGTLLVSHLHRAFPFPSFDDEFIGTLNLVQSYQHLSGFFMLF